MTRRLSTVVLLALGLSALYAPGCTARPTYVCASNEVCVSETGGAGICETNGFCSFPDTACKESGRRYPDGAGNGLASGCVTASTASKCIVSLSLGASHSCLVKSDGGVYCWGANDTGQLGDGTNVAKSTPTRVSLPNGAKAATVQSGEGHTCALSTTGDVYCWGLNATHQLGVGASDTNAPVAVKVLAGTPPAPVAVQKLSVGGKHTCAVADHLVYCWGENSDGQCGADPKAPGNDDIQTPSAVPGLEGVVDLAIGDEFSCALRDDKSVFCWGANANGELGNGTTTPGFTPGKVAISSVTTLAAGDEHVCGVKDDGTVFCWGYGQSGAVGNGAKVDALTPVSIATAKTVIAGGESFHSCAIQLDGAFTCWGSNDAQQLGVSRPDANVLAPTPVGLVTVNAAATGGKHTCAVTLDGALWCWGANDVGQLGAGATGAPQPSPARTAFSCGP